MICVGQLLLTPACPTDSTSNVESTATATATASPPIVRIVGQVVHIRQLSRRLVFFDLKHAPPSAADGTRGACCATAAAALSNGADLNSDHVMQRIEVIAKSPDIDVERVQDMRHSVSAGDRVCFHGWLEYPTPDDRRSSGGVATTHPPILHAVLVESLVRWRNISTVAFIPQPVSVRQPHAKASSSSSSPTPSPSPSPSPSSSPSPSPSSAVSSPTTTTPPPPCKYWLNTGHCPRHACQYYHGAQVDPSQRLEWVRERRQQRRQQFLTRMLEHEVALDDEQVVSRRQRAALFAAFLLEHFGSAALSSGTGVLDVAGGRGELAFELQCVRRVPCTLIEPRPMKLDRRQAAMLRKRPELVPPPQIQALFDDALCRAPEHAALIAGASIVVAMHPDQATEPAVDVALRCGKPFAVVPCCVFSRQFPERRLDGQPVSSYEHFVEYLRRKHPRSQVAYLPFQGKNCVVYVPADLDLETATTMATTPTTPTTLAATVTPELNE